MNYLRKSTVLILLAVGMYSCDAIIYETDISEETVVIIAPTENVTVPAGTVNFNWEAVAEATEYQFQIAVPNFTEAVQVVTDSVTTTTSMAVELEVNSYQWQVRAINDSYKTAYTTHKLAVE